VTVPGGPIEAHPPLRRGLLLSGVDGRSARHWLRLMGHEGWLVPDEAAGLVFVGGVSEAVGLAGTSGAGTDRIALVAWYDDDGGQIDHAVADEDGVEALGDVAGLVVLARGRVLTAHSWSADGVLEMGDAHLIASALGRPDVEVGLRALCAGAARARWPRSPRPSGSWGRRALPCDC
jgi:hypothetical protein